MVDAEKLLWEALREGVLVATGRRGGADDVEEIPSVQWRDLTILDGPPRSGIPFARQRVPNVGRPVWTEVYVKRLDMREKWKADSGSGMKRKQTVAAERVCAEWLADLMRRGSREKPKTAYFKAATDKFSISRRGFDRAWRAAVEASGNIEWTKPGR